MIDQGILEKTLEFAPGEWLLSSYIATGIENVPIFIKADNAEEEIEKHLPNNKTSPMKRKSATNFRAQCKNLEGGRS